MLCLLFWGVALPASRKLQTVIAEVEVRACVDEALAFLHCLLALVLPVKRQAILSKQTPYERRRSGFSPGDTGILLGQRDFNATLSRPGMTPFKEPCPNSIQCRRIFLTFTFLLFCSLQSNYALMEYFSGKGTVLGGPSILLPIYALCLFLNNLLKKN